MPHNSHSPPKRTHTFFVQLNVRTVRKVLRVSKSFFAMLGNPKSAAGVEETERADERDVFELDSAFSRRLGAIQARIWLIVFIFLLVVGILVGLQAAAVQIAVFKLLEYRMYWVDLIAPSNGGFIAARFFMFLLWGLVFTLIPTYVGTRYPHIHGAGIAQLKVLLSGSGDWKLLSFPVWISKLLTLCLAASSGLPIGTFGPFIHIGACNVYNLLQLRLFAPLRTHKTLVHSLLIIGCSTGAAGSWGVPLGGLLFGIEVVTNFYWTRTYLLGLFAPLVAGLTFLLFFNLWRIYDNGALPDTYSETRHLVSSILELPNEFSFRLNATQQYHFAEYISFFIFGIVLGLMAAVSVFLIAMVVRIRESICDKFESPRAKIAVSYVHTIIAIVSVSILAFPDLIGKYMAFGNLRTVQMMFGISDNHAQVVDTQYGAAQTNEGTEFLWSLLWILIVRFFLTPLATTAPLPAGMLFPATVIGAVSGRLWGEIMLLMFPNGIEQCNHFFFQGDTCFHIPIQPSRYAVIGGAAFTAAFTHTLSSAVVIMELVSGFSWMFPVLFTTTIAMFIQRLLIPGTYETLIYVLNLEYNPELNFTNDVWNSTITDFVSYFQTPFQTPKSQSEWEQVKQEIVRMRRLPSGETAEPSPVESASPESVQVTESASVSHVSNILALTNCSYLLVRKDNELVGIIQKSSLSKFGMERLRSKKPFLKFLK